MDDFIEDAIAIFGFLIIGLIVIAILGCGIMIGVNGFGYLNDKSICDVYVDNQRVYNDRCHFIGIHSIGENGFTKQLTIYKDIFGFKPSKKYVSENIVVR
jgi:hypothetical protein